MLFRKCGCLVSPENRIFRKSISFDRKKYALTTEIHFRSYFHFKWFPDRQRERESERKKRANPELQSNPTIAGKPRAPIWRSHTPVAPVSLIVAPRRSHRTAQSREFQSDDHTHQIAPHRSILPSCDLAFYPPISLSVWFWFLCDFDFCCCCGGVVVVAFDFWSLLPWVELSCEKFVGK